jgi:hypothetical protein
MGVIKPDIPVTVGFAGCPAHYGISGELVEGGNFGYCIRDRGDDH